MKPNIFDIATKELHQDAFIAWLMQWADKSNESFDKHLHDCGQAFLKELIKSQYQIDFETIERVHVDRQWEGIDVCAEIYTSKDNYLIIIEDKTFSSEHSDQLLRYKETAERFCAEHGFLLVCVYLKTANEPIRDLEEIRKKGYKTFGRIDFLNILVRFPAVRNDIFLDFKDRLQRLEADYTSYESVVIGEWNDACWIGFYSFLDIQIGLVTWHFVNPPAGNGFWNACLNWEDWNGFPVYLQIEQGKLCFKIATRPNEISYEGEYNRTEKRNQWHNIVVAEAGKKGLHEIKRPARFGNGNFMTTAVVGKEEWLGKDDEIIEKMQVIERLQLYKEFLKKCLLKQLSINSGSKGDF